MEEQQLLLKKKKKNFRKRSASADDSDEPQDEQERRMALEEVKLVQKQRQRKSGIPAISNSSANLAVGGGGGGGNGNTSDKKAVINKVSEGGVLESGGADVDKDKDKDKDDLVLQDTFAQETAVMVEDPNMLKYVEQELAKRRGRKLDESGSSASADLLDNDLYKIPDHLKVKKRNSEESSTQWTTGIAEVQLPIEFKLRNIEETEAAKKLLQEKRLVGSRTKSDITIPSSYNADYFQRGRDYAEKLRREHPELYKDRTSSQDEGVGVGVGSRQHETGTEAAAAAAQRQAATDQFMLERFRKRERLRVMRR